MGSSGSKPSKGELDLLILTTKFSKQDIKKELVSFKEKYPSGKMTEDEFIAFYTKKFLSAATGDTKGFCRIIFNVFKTLGGEDTGNTLTFLPYMRGLSGTIHGDESDKRRWCWGVYDSKCNGELSFDDVLVIQKEFYKMYPNPNLPEIDSTPEKRCERFFNVLGKEKAQTLTKGDFGFIYTHDQGSISVHDPVENMAKKGKK